MDPIQLLYIRSNDPYTRVTLDCNRLTIETLPCISITISYEEPNILRISSVQYKKREAGEPLQQVEVSLHRVLSTTPWTSKKSSLIGIRCSELFLSSIKYIETQDKTNLILHDTSRVRTRPLTLFAYDQSKIRWNQPIELSQLHIRCVHSSSALGIGTSIVHANMECFGHGKITGFLCTTELKVITNDN